MENIHRRAFAKLSSAAVLCASQPLGAKVPREARNVKIVGLEIFHVKVNHRGNWTIVRLQTNAGITGLGEASHGGKDTATVEFLKQFVELLKGRSIFDVEWFHKGAAP